eukprot:TRINITY_DN11323_c0_g1_i1.p1 TRINITY_DN11323_c0_g1~~TRINITY_DN11323_c0_g1_i1.p1  ORF type:complete len:496 (+),score=129.30 TRINITY_DN11323_c0_g1_i1:117-1604(+)
MSADIGLIGLAVMGENLVLNFESHGYTVAVHNRTISKIADFTKGRAHGKRIIGCDTIQELINSLKKPRRIMIMVRAGNPVDEFINHLAPLLEKGDIIIDGGNSHFPDSERRTRECEARGLLFVGAGVSGGEEGALKGPSIMPGGSDAAWQHIGKMFKDISAKVEDGSACCEWVGHGGAGHFVKMVHNGIEYGDMQMICEAYDLLRRFGGFNNEELADIFDEWNKGDLDSYLIQITSEILRKKDEPVTIPATKGSTTNEYVIDNILDAAQQKGTGKWTAQVALDLGIPVTLIGEAVFARCLSNLKELRGTASQLFPQTKSEQLTGDKRKNFVENVRKALYASKIISYTQGFHLMRVAAAEFKWELKYGDIALMWRGGCIIRSKFLAKIKEAYDANPNLEILIFDKFFQKIIQDCEEGWRFIMAEAMKTGVPVPAMSCAVSYYDGLRRENLPANLLQAQRDYFGAHQYERIDHPRGQYFHTNWTGHGGTTAAGQYGL